MTAELTALCQKIWEEKQWPKESHESQWYIMRGVNIDEGHIKSFKNSTETPPVQCFSAESRETSSGHQWASVRDVYDPVQTFP
ncbi:hypothetical protein DPMN_047192 [Dreissena polymorpha]|uniref:Uncharacterized protein n=1 Tax=Dreissena polymorpha TaxID=45954 RepID=A0A9D4I2W8_DREPO|nr:hypothetical protein DPMN_047192 [Dreissena polymorpha]